jgi:hypothetical protein
MPSVTADVEEGAERPFAVPDEHDGDVTGACGRVRARLSERAGVPGVLPRRREDPLPLEPQPVGVRVPGPRECAYDGETVVVQRATILVLAALVLGGCGGSDASAPSGTETQQPPETATTATEATTSIVVYFLRAGKVAPVYREVPQTQAVGTAAVEALLEGPTASEEGLGVESALPDDAALGQLTVTDGAAAVDLSEGELSPEALAQLTFTLTQFSTVNGVWVAVRGEPIGPQDHPLTRQDFPDLTPNILVERPALGESVSSPVHVSGTASVFEATLRVRLVGPDGETLRDDVVTASEGAPGRGTFSVEIPFGASGSGAVEAYTISAADGSEQHNVEVPVELAP